MEENRLVEFFKLFSDANRIRMAALLLDEALTVEELAARLKLRPADAPRQLSQFEKLDLLIKDGSRYRFNSKNLERLSRETLAGLREQAPDRSQDEDATDFDHKVVKDYSLPDGRLKEIPYQDKKLQAILRHVVQVFEPGRRYTEKEVNIALVHFHRDVEFLRRMLIEKELMDRERNGSAYWRK